MKKKNYFILFIIFVTITLIFTQQNISSALSGKEIITKAETAIRGNSQISLVEITIKTKRWTRTLEVKSWDDRLKKRSFSEITAPKKDAGNRFLLIDKNMTHYIPKLQKDIKISPSMMLQSWMGSDFSNDDIVKESSIIEDYTHSVEGKTTVNGFECYKIGLKPKPKAVVVWGSITYYVRINDYLPVRVEYYNEHKVLKKFMTFSDYKKMHDRVIPTRYKMQSAGKEDRYTALEIKKVKFNTQIPNNIFTLQNLKRR